MNAGAADQAAELDERVTAAIQTSATERAARKKKKVDLSRERR